MYIKRENLTVETKDKEIYIYTLSNEKESMVRITNYGGIVLSVSTADKDGVLDDVVLGFDDFNDYMINGVYFGAVIGRYANRIEDATIEVENKVYKLAKNDGNNHLHGGNIGFNKVIWNSEIKSDDIGEYLQLSYLSKDGEENYPGNLKVVVNYRLTHDNELIINYFAETDKATVINLTNHSYFNLGGHSSGDILKHKLKICGEKITVANKESIPTGEIRNIKNTPMDFTEFKEVGKDIECDYDQINFGKGYDHNWIIDGTEGELRKAAELVDDKTGRVMEVFTTKPGMQFYSGNFLDGSQIGKGGVKYDIRAGLCLETQYYPDSLNHEGFSNVILKPGEKYNHTTVYKFGTIK